MPSKAKNSSSEYNEIYAMVAELVVGSKPIRVGPMTYSEARGMQTGINGRFRGDPSYKVFTVIRDLKGDIIPKDRPKDDRFLFVQKTSRTFEEFEEKEDDDSEGNS